MAPPWEKPARTIRMGAMTAVAGDRQRHPESGDRRIDHLSQLDLELR
jgi:hypothetical protein